MCKYIVCTLQLSSNLLQKFLNLLCAPFDVLDLANGNVECYLGLPLINLT